MILLLILVFAAGFWLSAGIIACFAYHNYKRGYADAERDMTNILSGNND